MALAPIEPIEMASDPLTTIPVHASTRAELARLKSGGQSYDEVIHAILEELRARDPWLEEMQDRLEEIKAGKVKLIPFEALQAKSRRLRGRGAA